MGVSGVRPPRQSLPRINGDAIPCSGFSAPHHVAAGARPEPRAAGVGCAEAGKLARHGYHCWSAAMSKTVYLINGPNLNLLGKREPAIYGADTLDDVTSRCDGLARSASLTLTAMQSNHEGQIIDWIHEARDKAQAILINPGAFTHTSVAIFDALQAFEGLVFEIHITNVHKREPFRHHSYVSARAEGVLAGFGVEGYELALRRVITLLA